MENLKKQRKTLRALFTRATTELLKEVNQEITKKTLNMYMDAIEKKSEQLAEVDKDICELMMADEDISEDDIDKEFEGRIVYENKLFECRRTVEEIFSKITENSEIDTHSSSGRSQVGVKTSKKYKLPKIELKKFSGDIKEWLSFWAQFEKIHNDEDIAEEDKFHYLQQSTEEKSKAREVVDSFPMTAANYQKMVSHLKSRFGNKDMLVEVYVRELLKLVLSNALNPTRITVISSLYDKLETQLRALESLDVTRDKFTAILYPLVESCLPEELLRTWQRNRIVPIALPVTNQTIGGGEVVDRLTHLMLFLKVEVENEERISLARSGFSEQSKRNQKEEKAAIATAADLFVGATNVSCVFCGKGHFGNRCFLAKKMSVSERQRIVNERKGCRTCLNNDHQTRECPMKLKLKCHNCGGAHFKFICNETSDKKVSHVDKAVDKPENNSENSTEKNILSIKQENCAANSTDKKNSSEEKSTNLMVREAYKNEVVVLSTFLIHIVNGNKTITIRCAIDSGSQRTYLLKRHINHLNYEKTGEETLYHELFGGSIVSTTHNRYTINAKSLDGSYKLSFDVLDQERICHNVPKIPSGPWIQELEKKKILLTDLGNKSSEIDLLIGSNLAGKLMSGFHKFDENSEFGKNMVAINYSLGWTIMGEIPSCNVTMNSSLLVKDLFVNELDVSDLWRLDVIGITDAAGSKEKERNLKSIEEKFKKSLTVNDEGRQEIKLPFVKGCPTLGENKNLAEKRLSSLTKKLTPDMRTVYQKVFDDWEARGIIEKVPSEQRNHPGHYLPHKAVYKPSSLTTPVRPVFDASAKDVNSISLNKCLETGPNLLEVISTIILRFRMRRFGVLADIEKAFLQISIDPTDRDYLRFLWWDTDGNVIVYRHKRLVFGLTCSSFILAMVINNILDHAPDELKSTAIQLKASNYVDNCITSLDDENAVQKFKTESVQLMEIGKFNLRNWVSNSSSSNDTLNKVISTLGLTWNLDEDTLSCDINKGIKEGVSITKRMILSATHQIFDPIGMTLPLIICPKIYIQQCWELKVGWDEELPLDISKKFRKWISQLAEIKQIKIPRWIGCTSGNLKNCTFHVFSDASKVIYAAAVFMRIETDEGVLVNLVQAKARVSPLNTKKKSESNDKATTTIDQKSKTESEEEESFSIPRLELLGCLIGVRLVNSVKHNLGMEDTRCVHWTDATDALYWIKNEDCWGPFVANRVKEIRESTENNDWKHVPGKQNPADILTRGVSAKRLVESRWWEGPLWLNKPENEWPSTVAVPDQAILQRERKKKTTCNFSLALTTADSTWLTTCKFKNDYQKILKVTACILRFRRNILAPKEDRINGPYTANELNIAEKRIIAMIQKETFTANESELKDMEVYADEDNVLRIKTKLTLREDDNFFIAPAVIPGKHPIVRALIEYYHRKYSHAGTQTTMSILRERFWVIRCRVAVRKVINDCTICKRYRGKTFETKPTYLPLERVRDAAVYEATGVDLAGPLNLRGTGKAWIVIYTCAVYRAVHLELVSSMSTDSFIQSFRRFIARRGRPSSMWCDRGTNLVGAKNQLMKLDWDKISKAAAELKIEWSLNPPKAPWWGGWWERLIGVVKSILKRCLGNAYLHYEEMLTILCDIESIVNERPLTYLSEDSNELRHLSPSSFLKDIRQSGVPDLDGVDSQYINRKNNVRQKLMNDLRKRFRLEYLGQLLQQNSTNDCHPIQEGEIVLVADHDKKNVNWPLGKIVALHPGKDSEVRVVTVKTKTGTLVRPVKGLVPLEIRSSEFSGSLVTGEKRTFLANNLSTPNSQSTDSISRLQSDSASEATIRTTRSGRQVKLPSRYGQ